MTSFAQTSSVDPMRMGTSLAIRFGTAGREATNDGFAERQLMRKFGLTTWHQALTAAVLQGVGQPHWKTYMKRPFTAPVRQLLSRPTPGDIYAAMAAP